MTPFSKSSPFSQYFEIVPAFDAATRDAAHRVRHAIYCEDLGFEPIRPDGRERDDYDSHALHCLLRHLMSNRYVGVTRLVLPPHTAPHTPLPFERTCAAALYRGRLDPARMPRQQIAEVSRLGIIRDFRRRRGEDRSPLPLSENDFGSTNQPRFPFISIGLYLAAIALARELGISRLFTLTEPRLAQHFSRFGVEVVQVGDPIEHRGQRVPSMIDIDDAIAHIGPMLQGMWNDVQSGITGKLDTADAHTRLLASQPLRVSA